MIGQVADLGSGIGEVSLIDQLQQELRVMDHLKGVTELRVVFAQAIQTMRAMGDILRTWCCCRVV